MPAPVLGSGGTILTFLGMPDFIASALSLGERVLGGAVLRGALGLHLHCLRWKVQCCGQ